MSDIDTIDPDTTGSKGLVFIGKKLLVYRRDTNTELFPLLLDLPGGAPEGNETPFETFKREVREEFGLSISRDAVIYTRLYPSVLQPGMSSYFLVARLSSEKSSQIIFGDEGTEYMLLEPGEYLARTDAEKEMQRRTQDYLQTRAK